MSQTISVEQLVDEQKIGPFNYRVLFWSFLALLADGYEISAMAFAAPDLVREWGVAKQAFGPVFSASLFGILFGAPLLGYAGDRYGRRIAIIAGSVIFGLTTLATVWAQNLEQLVALRFLTGIGIGGLLPNAIALNSELAPKRRRATLVVLMFVGITFGNASAGPVAAWLMPQYGWEVLFLIGGVVPLIVAVGLYFALPESVKFLAMHPRRRTQLLATARQMRPDLVIVDDAEFTIEHAHDHGGIGLREVFSDGMAWITSLLWLCFCMSLMALYFFNSWMPLLFQENGAPPEQAAVASTLYYVGGAAGSIVMSVLLDRFGFRAIAGYFALGVPAVAAVGMFGDSFALTSALAALTGFAVLGAQLGNNASAGLIYPTAYRSKGVGWAFAFGRFGSIAGPLLGAQLIAMQLSMTQIFLASAVPLVIGALTALALAQLCHARFGGMQLDDKAAR